MSIWNVDLDIVDLDIVDLDIVDLEFRIATIMCGPHSIAFDLHSLVFCIPLFTCPNVLFVLSANQRAAFFGSTKHLKSTNSKLSDRFTTAAPYTDHRHTVLVIRAFAINLCAKTQH